MLRGLSDRLKLRRGSAADRDGATAAAATAVGAGAAEPAPRHASLPHPDSGILVGGGSTEAEAKAALAELAPGYFDPQFDALEHELRQLPVDFDQAALEAVAEERTGVLEVRALCSQPASMRWCSAGLPRGPAHRRARRGGGGAPPPPSSPAHATSPPPSNSTQLLQVVSERLSAHVISHYDKFVAGVDEVTQVGWGWHRAVCGHPCSGADVHWDRGGTLQRGFACTHGGWCVQCSASSPPSPLRPRRHRWRRSCRWRT